MRLLSEATKIVEKISSRYPLLMNLYGLYYKNIVKKEINLGDISIGDRVLCIGGGAFPSTAITIARETGAKVKVIDHDSIAVMKSRELISKLGLSSQIEVADGKGENVDPREFTVIHVALQVHKREEILKCLLSKVDSKTRILVRTPDSSLADYSKTLRVQSICKRCDDIREDTVTMKSVMMFTRC